jgi:hypothetical protein
MCSHLSAHAEFGKELIDLPQKYQLKMTRRAAIFVRLSLVYAFARGGQAP